LGADGNVYAVAQGSLAISGFQAGRCRQDRARVPTWAACRTAPSSSARSNSRSTSSDSCGSRCAIPTSHRQAHRFRDQRFHRCRPPNRSTVDGADHHPEEFEGNVIALLTEVEQLQIEADLTAKVIIDERSASS